MSLLEGVSEEELRELRRLVVRCAVTFFVCTAFFCAPMPLIGGTFVDAVYDWCVRFLGDAKIIALNPASPLIIFLELAVLLGGVVSFPFCLWFVWSYVKPALYPREVKIVKQMLMPLAVAFYFGSVYGLFIVAPVVLRGFAYVGPMMIGVEPVYGLSEVVGMVVGASLISAVVMLIPPLLRTLIKLGIVEKRNVMKYRWWMYLAVFSIILLIDNEPFLFTETLVTAPLIAITEITLRI